MQVQPITNQQQSPQFGAKIKLADGEIGRFINKVPFLDIQKATQNGLLLDMFEKCAPNHVIEMSIERAKNKSSDLSYLVAKNLNTKAEIKRDIKTGFEHEWENNNIFYSLLRDLLSGDKNLAKDFWGNEYKAADYTNPNSFTCHSVFNA